MMLEQDQSQFAPSSLQSSRVEITVQSLQGISVTARGGPIPHVTATIAFNGSVPDMQVGSSTVCAITGQLVIASEPACLDRSSSMMTTTLTPTHSSTDKRYHQLTADWRDERIMANCFQPHLSLTLPETDPRAHKMPLSCINRDSRIVKDTDTVSTTSISSSLDSISENASQLPRGGSAVWSNSGLAALPEIIELYISLNTNDGVTDGQLWQGMAYFVVFGHKDDAGSFVMDLPVKKPSHSNLTVANDSPNITLTPQARLRVKVKVIPSETKTPTKTPYERKLASSSSESHREIFLSLSQMEGQMEEVMKNIQRNEDQALKQVQDQSNAMNANLPADGCPPQGHVFCDGLWNWDRVLRAISSVVGRCDAGTEVAVVIPESNSSVCSTIATRASLDI
jgi:hypothetical protein